MWAGAVRRFLIAVSVLGACLNNAVSAAPEAPFKTFAVFTVSYNTGNNEARGGVAGTLFFVSPREAITAYHVLNAKSFKPAPGFERVRVWLLHEGHAPIEVKAEYLAFQADKDLTRVRLPENGKVPDRFVFTPAGLNPQIAYVETEGFRANTGGPLLARQGADLTVLSVRRLERLRSVGKILRQATVDLNAADVRLKASPNVQLSYQPVVGLSGGPVISAGRVIAMNSFADPSTFAQTWALVLNP